MDAFYLYFDASPALQPSLSETIVSEILAPPLVRRFSSNSRAFSIYPHVLELSQAHFEKPSVSLKLAIVAHKFVV